MHVGQKPAACKLMAPTENSVRCMISKSYDLLAVQRVDLLFSTNGGIDSWRTQSQNIHSTRTQCMTCWIYLRNAQTPYPSRSLLFVPSLVSANLPVEFV